MVEWMGRGSVTTKRGSALLARGTFVKQKMKRRLQFAEKERGICFTQVLYEIGLSTSIINTQNLNKVWR
jgi:hypothetical protein